MNVNKLNYLIIVIALFSFFTYIYTQGVYIWLLIISVCFFTLSFLIKKQFFKAIMLFSLGSILPFIEYFFGCIGKKVFVVLGGIFVIIVLVRKYIKGENIWH